MCIFNLGSISHAIYDVSFVLDDSNTGDHGDFHEAFVKQFQNIIAPFLAIGLVLYSFSLGSTEEQQVYIHLIHLLRKKGCLL